MGSLKKQTKTILLHNGMQDDVDDFLIEAPAVERVENGVFDKQGVISKRRGFEALPDNGLSVSSDGAATVIVGGSTLVVPNKNGASIYNPDTEEWTDVDSSAVFTTCTRGYSTQSGAGACHYHLANLDGFQVVAYEVVGNKDLDLTSSEVILELVDSNNVLIQRRRYTGYSPQLAKPANTDDYVILTYLSGALGSESLKTLRLTGSTNTVSSTRTTSLGIGPYEQEFYARVWTHNWVPDRANYRLRPTATGAVVVYCDDQTTTPNIEYRFISAASSSAAPTVGSATTFATIPASDLSSTHPAFTKILDVYFRLDSVELFVLYTYIDPQDTSAGLDSTVVLVLNDGTTARTLETWTGLHSKYLGEVDIWPSYCAGSIVESGSNIWAAITRIGVQPTGAADDPTTRSGTIADGPAQTRFYTAPVDLSSSTLRHTRYGHRLASTLVEYDDAVYGCLQQYAQRCQGGIAKGAADGVKASPNQYSTPYATHLCAISTSTIRPVASLGTNRGTTTAVYGGAQSSTLPDLYSTDAGVQTIVPISEEASGVILEKNFGTTAGIDQVFPISAGSRFAEVWAVDIDTTPTPTTIGRGVLFASGLPLWFDGQRFAESTPLVRPEVLWCTGDVPLDALLPDAAPSDMTAVHSIKCVYSYTDSNGTLHRSAPGNVAYVPKDRPGGGTNSEEFTLYVTSPLSVLNSSDTLILEVYALVDSIYKRVHAAEVSAHTSSAVRCTVTLEPDGDALVSSGKALYTEGGVLPADPVPPCTLFASAVGRLVGVTDDPRSTIVYTKPLEATIGPEFPAAFTFPLGTGVVVTGIAGLDDKIIVFSADEIHVLYGAGPDATARGSSFAIMRLPSSAGCIDAKSIVEIPGGLMFRGRRGFYILGRDLSIRTIRGANDMLVGMTVVNATAIPTTGEVRFLLSATGTQLDSDGPTPDSTRPAKPKYGNSGMVAGVLTQGHALCYNYERDQWSIFTNYRGVSATLLNGVYVCLKNDYDVWVESETVFTDPEVTNATVSSNLLRITTPWIKLNGLQSYGRIWSATFLGRYLSDFTEDENGDLAAGDITIKVAYDYEKDDTQTHVFKASEELQPELRDGEIVSAQRLQIKVVPKRQKCSAIRFTIEETNTADADGLTYRPGQGFEIPAIELELGMKDTANKSLSAQRKK